MFLKQFLTLTKSDLHRYAGNSNLRAFLYHYLFSPGYKYSFWMRLCAYITHHKVLKVFFPLAWLIYYHYQIKFGIAISYQEKIGSGLYIGHHGGIVTNEKSVI